MKVLAKLIDAAQHPRQAAKKVLRKLFQRDRLRTSLRFFRRRAISAVPVDLEKLEAIHAETFPAEGPEPWLDRPDAEQQIASRLERGELDAEQAARCRHWAREGYVHFQGLLSRDSVQSTWAAYEEAVTRHAVFSEFEHGVPNRGRCQNSHLVVPQVRALLHHPEILRWMGLLLGRSPIPFQTLCFTAGSQQLEHGDSIHMSTWPLGYMAAAWVACEDVHSDAGPLKYYPGTHKLPYLFSKDAGIGPEEREQLGSMAYRVKYEPAIQRILAERGLEPQILEARQGDVFFWHANLLHGGLPRKNLELTRKSIVCHYFFDGAYCFHDLTGELADVTDALKR